eukprot:TRINITY_DN9850_c0_g1_i2.p1 TRINITY_DN9850_c0_g1~~TRINITY_DN9850_c0_g1_i2.p1  ORF type:complete len:222 (+),score=24.39 TRINITY_DN9850_c0_g1_i2:185-850(+)
MLKLIAFQEFSLSLENYLSKVFLFCSKSPDTMTSYPHLSIQISKILEFCLRFDDAKIVNPGLQNDLSFFRRKAAVCPNIICRLGMMPESDMFSRMIFFFAKPNPMMSTVKEVIQKSLKSDVSVTELVSNFSLLANSFQDMISNNVVCGSNKVLAFHAIAGSILIVDHFHPAGAFCRKSPINIKACLVNFRDEPIYGIINTIRWTSMHFNDPNTPADIKRLL